MRLTIPLHSSAHVIPATKTSEITFPGTVLTGLYAADKRDAMAMASGTYESSWKG